MEGRKPALAVVVVMLVLANWSTLAGLIKHTTDVTPVPGLDMFTVFHESIGEGVDAATDADRASAMFESLAGCLDWDSKWDKKFCTAGDFEDYRVSMIRYFNQGQAFAARYPKFGAVVGSYLTDAAGDNGDEGSLSDADRKKWTDALRNLSRACKHASGEL